MDCTWNSRWDLVPFLTPQTKGHVEQRQTRAAAQVVKEEEEFLDHNKKDLK
jgi:hypothetical protein